MMMMIVMTVTMMFYRLVMALDGMKIIKIAAGGWHSAAISG